LDKVIEKLNTIIRLSGTELEVPESEDEEGDGTGGSTGGGAHVDPNVTGNGSNGSGEWGGDPAENPNKDQISLADVDTSYPGSD
jgi:hypothetical protein